jgi:hypothetical protein
MVPRQISLLIDSLRIFGELAVHLKLKSSDIHYIQPPYSITLGHIFIPILALKPAQKEGTYLSTTHKRYRTLR